MKFMYFSSLWMEISKLPPARFGTEPLPSHPPHEDWNLGRSWHFEFWLLQNSPPQNLFDIHVSLAKIHIRFLLPLDIVLLL